MLDWEGRGFLVTHLNEHDSAPLEPGSPAMQGHDPIGWTEFEKALARDVGFLDAASLRQRLSGA